MLAEMKNKPPQSKDKPCAVFGNQGLRLLVSPSGAKAWRGRCMIEGRNVRKTIGSWPLVSQNNARELNHKDLHERETGIVKEAAPASFTVEAARVKRRERFMP